MQLLQVAEMYLWQGLQRKGLCRGIVIGRSLTVDGFMCCLHGTQRDFDWCEDNCSRYSHCDTVAWARDGCIDNIGAYMESQKNSDNKMLDLYEVTITETLKKTVNVNASSRGEAERIVSDDWYDSEHILDAGDFESVAFEARKAKNDGGGQHGKI